MSISFTATATRPRPAIGLLLSAMLCGQAIRAQDPFTRILSGPVVSGVNSTILAWGDFNNDGFQDLFVSTRTGPSLLYSNNGDGTFSQILAGPIATDSGNCFGVTWGDYDNDGFLDLFVGVNSNGNDWLYHNNGHGGFSKVTTGAIVNSGGNANNTSWADYDNDGFLDLFVANSDQNDFLYHNNRDGTFTRVMTNAIALKTGNSQGGSWADYDNDGLPDLFVSRVNEPNLLYHNEGNGIFTSVTNGVIVHDVSTGQGTSWGDYDNDGFLDLFVVNPNAPNFLYHNNGDGTFNKITNGPVVTDIGNGHGCGWADYDNDGFLDLFVANRLGSNFLYHNNGDGTFTRVTTGVVPADVADASSAAWGDYDNDGFPDLFVTELNPFSNRLYRNNGNSNAWLTLKLEGRLSNRTAIGAKVRVKATMGGQTVWQLREISGGGGLGSQNDLRAGFGLGNATNVDVVRIEWPSGIKQEFHDVAVKQFLTIVEPEAQITPATLAVQGGEVATFTVANTLPPPIFFQWKLGGVALAGETNATLTIANVQTRHAGMYSVEVDAPAMGVHFETRSASLTGPVNITQQPTNVNVRLGSNTVLVVNAAGISPIHCQWQFNGVSISGATNTTLTLTNVQLVHEGDYVAFVSNSFGAVWSDSARLIVLIRPTITIFPVSQSIVAGGSVTLSAVTEGHPLPLTFRWFKSGVVLTNMEVNGTMGFLVLTNLQPTATTNAFAYRLIVTNLAGPSSTSPNIFVTVLADTDGDGMPDEWELVHGFDATNSADASDDADGDGMTNAQEYAAGTDPYDPQSVMRVSSVTCDGTNSWRVSFLAISNRTYSLQAREVLDAGSTYRSVADVLAMPTNRVVEIIQPAGNFARQQFFRLITPRQP